LLLAGCSSETPRPAPPPASLPPAVAKEDLRPLIVCFGDSLTAGYGLEAGVSYPDSLQKRLDAANAGYRVFNAGVSGDTTAGGLSRLAATIAMKPEIVIVELGGNDGLRGVPTKESRENLAQIIGGFQQAGARVLLAGITLPPNYGAEYIAGLRTMYASLAKEKKAALMPFFLDGVWDQPGMMQADGIHPTASGCERVAERVEQALQPLLRSGR
jgi:acyl-CoA thioesterase I